MMNHQHTLRVSLGVLAAVCVLSFTASCGLMRSAHEQGVNYLDAGDYQAAYEAFSQAVEDARAAGDDEQLAIALANRSFANDALLRHEEAVKDATESLELRPDVPLVINNRGVAYLNMRMFDEALADFDRAIELDPEYAEAYANRGRLHVTLEDYDLGMEDLDRAIELDDTLAMAYANRAVAHDNLGDVDAALEDYARAIELERDPEVLFSRAMMLFRYARYEDALDDFRTVAKLAPDTYTGYRAKTQVEFLEEFVKNLEEVGFGVPTAEGDGNGGSEAGDDQGSGLDDGSRPGGEDPAGDAGDSRDVGGSGNGDGASGEGGNG
jgi:tetratricopeptide (TPR) repeat protein